RPRKCRARGEEKGGGDREREHSAGQPAKARAGVTRRSPPEQRRAERKSACHEGPRGDRRFAGEELEAERDAEGDGSTARARGARPLAADFGAPGPDDTFATCR